MPKIIIQGFGVRNPALIERKMKTKFVQNEKFNRKSASKPAKSVTKNLKKIKKVQKCPEILKENDSESYAAKIDDIAASSSQDEKNPKISPEVKKLKSSIKTFLLERTYDPAQDAATIFIGNLPPNTKKKDIAKFFQTYDPIVSIRLRTSDGKLIEKHSERKECVSLIAYVVLQDEESAINALCLNGALFKGNFVRVTRANSEDIKKSIYQNKNYQKRTVFVGNIKNTSCGKQTKNIKFRKNCSNIFVTKTMSDQKFLNTEPMRIKRSISCNSFVKNLHVAAVIAGDHSQKGNYRKKFAYVLNKKLSNSENLNQKDDEKSETQFAVEIKKKNEHNTTNSKELESKEICLINTETECPLLNENQDSILSTIINEKVAVKKKSNTMSAEDNDRFKRVVFVSELTYKVTDNTLRDVFSTCGDVEYVRTFPKKNMGCAFVCFKRPESVGLALELQNTIVDGRPIRVTRYKLNIQGKNEHKTSSVIIVHDINDSTPVEEVRKKFSKYGPLDNIELIDNKGKISALIRYKNPQSAMKATKLKNIMLNGSCVRVATHGKVSPKVEKKNTYRGKTMNGFKKNEKSLKKKKTPNHMENIAKLIAPRE